jgi:hypothetical protein
MSPCNSTRSAASLCGVTTTFSIMERRTSSASGEFAKIRGEQLSDDAIRVQIAIVEDRLKLREKPRKPPNIRLLLPPVPAEFDRLR